MGCIKRIFVEKKKDFAVEAEALFNDLKNNLGIESLAGVRVINRYDMTGISEAEYAQARDTIFSEPTVDLVYDEVLTVNGQDRVFAMEYLPGQYDQRADSAAQCVQLLTGKERPKILSAKVILMTGNISDADFVKIKTYCINPVESREASLDKPASVEMEAEIPQDVKCIEGFIHKNDAELKELLQDMGLAMTFEDLRFLQTYFRDEEQRDPTITEIRVIDTYWSDHCRHTTFLTRIEAVDFAENGLTAPIREAYEDYLVSRKFVYEDQEKDICLMDIAVIGMKELKKRGCLKDLDESDEINACSIVVNAKIDDRDEEWLVMFKNETHNHPTEIEPFGGAATCLGGAIRDPLSGRSYVYQAMRVTGSGDPRISVEDTLAGKLPQRKITTGAAAGYSSYGNQIGLATGQVTEVYDEGFVAKRMEIGAVIAAAPKRNVVRGVPREGDKVVLLGGKTGRDGCGGATGSSKEHTEDSILTCGAEVQKGNPPEERKIQRLFRNPEVSTLIKRCNDFGAGGVSVAIGELTDGLEINLDLVPKKYEGLDGTELAISESQERMAVVVEAADVERFIQIASQENLEATVVADVISENRLRMVWRGQTIVNISRDFLNTNGVKQSARTRIAGPDGAASHFDTIGEKVQNALNNLEQAWMENLQDLNVCSQKGMVERFDSTIGAGSVLMPFGGIYQETPAEGMVAKLPVLEGETSTGTAMTYGYNPKIANWSPFHGAMYAVVEAVAKIAAVGGDYRQVRLTLQEYFEKLGKDPIKWGKPFSALLGAFKAQKELGIPAIGGKDSMSGTFKDLNVPPTLVAFAVAPMDVNKAISPEFKKAGSKVMLVPLNRKEDETPEFSGLKKNLVQISALASAGKILAASVVKGGGLAEAISKMTFGNGMGMVFANEMDVRFLFKPALGSMVLEISDAEAVSELVREAGAVILGETSAEPVIQVNGIQISVARALEAWHKPLASVFPAVAETKNDTPVPVQYTIRNTHKAPLKAAKPKVFIPVFPGTNCEYDSARAFEKAGGRAETLVVRNLSSADIEYSVKALVKAIDSAQIVMLPGGFSAGDEPDGSGKFIATVFRNPYMKEAVMKLLKERDGLMLGICNGFQALIKLGLVPYGEITDITETSPTLTYNTIGRHMSSLVRTKVTSVLSPWFSNVNVGDIHTIPVSHGEGRFIASPEQIRALSEKGQIATQYVDDQGNPSSSMPYNPNGSVNGVEGITSPDGRVLGKMGHSERIGANLYRNVPGEKDQQIFEAGIRYFQ